VVLVLKLRNYKMALDKFLSEYTGPSGFPGTDCTPPVIPDATFTDCPDVYTAHEGEIDTIFISNVVQDGTTKQWEAVVAPSDWDAIASYAVSGIETLVGFGDKPLAEVVTVPLPKNRLKTIKRKHTLNFDFTDQLIANYEVVRALQGTEYVALWYKTIDGDIFGGATGIIARIANAGNEHSRGENALLTGKIIFTWEHIFDPPRAILDPPVPLTAKVQAPAPLKSKASKEAEATA
jgi:hypothetical protein